MLEFVEEEGPRQGLVGSLNSVRKRDANYLQCHLPVSLSVRYRHSEA